jgi:hypothetical protein
LHYFEETAGSSEVHWRVAFEVGSIYIQVGVDV